MDVDLNIDIFFDKVRTNGRVLHENAIYLTMRKEYNKSSKGKPPKGEERKKISMKKIMTGALVMSVMLAGGALAEGMNPGTYESTFRGYNADIRVKVAVCADRIESVEVAEQAESQNIGAKACEILPERIVNAQSIGVDSVSGATITSAAIKAAVRDALNQAGADIDVYSAVPEKTETKKTVELSTDVVVIGTGIAGESAAVTAQESGAQVILLEKQDIIGGSTNASGGAVMGVDSPLNDDGVDDTKEWADFIYDRDERHENVSYEKIKFVADVSGENIKWLMEKGYDPVLGYGGNSPVMWSHRPNDGTGKQLAHGGWKIINALNDAFISGGGTLMVATPATKLLTDETGKVVGVEAESEDTVYTIRAKGGVILACGGFDDNEKLIQKYAPKSDGWFNIGANVGDDGDAITLAEAVGAEIISTGYLMPSWTTLHRCELNGLNAFGLKNTANFIYVNEKMERYMNESEGMEGQKIKMIVDGSTQFYMVMDSTALDGAYVEQLESCVEKGLAFKGETLEEAAQQAGVDAQTLENTVTHWNEMAEAGADTDFGNEKVNPLNTAPYYIIPDSQGVTGSFGGVHINMDAQVLRADGTAIEGLYAAGECTNGDFYYRDYICGGSSLAMGMAFGRVAGENTAQNAIQ